MEALRIIAGRLDEAAASVADLRPHDTDPGGTAWGGDGNGALGDLAGALRRQLAAALVARGREVSTASARISELAASVRMAADNYVEADQAARRHSEGLP